MVEVSVIIPTYNRGWILRKSLEALFNQSYPKDKYEIILIDDGSTDDTETMIESLSSSYKFKYLRNKKRLGIPRTRNRGIRQAQGKYIIFTDSDVVASPDFIAQHMAYHKKYQEIIVNGELIRVPSFKQIGKKRKSIFDLSLSPFDTANVSVARKPLLEVGGFDEDLLAYGWQDLELGYRLRKAGLKCKRNRQALGYHYFKKKSLSDLPSLCEKEKMRGTSGALYYRKHPHLGVRFATQCNPIFLLAFIGKWIDKNKKGRKILAFCESHRIDWLFSLLVKLITSHYYLKGWREAMRCKVTKNLIR
jgi:GT2 family glycosyltransferase